jgi:hypothetical protein
MHLPALFRNLNSAFPYANPMPNESGILNALPDHSTRRMETGPHE